MICAMVDQYIMLFVVYSEWDPDYRHPLESDEFQIDSAEGAVGDDTNHLRRRPPVSVYPH